MKQAKLWMKAAILTLCGASVLTACTKDNIDNPANMYVFTPQLGDTWDAVKSTFTWQGTPSAIVPFHHRLTERCRCTRGVKTKTCRNYTEIIPKSYQ